MRLSTTSKGKVLKRSPKMLQLRRLLRQQILEAFLAPLSRHRRHGRRGGDTAAAARRDAPCNATADNLTVRLGPSVTPDHCTVPGRVLVNSLHYCSFHG